jgi:hypothetical protein
VLETAKSRHEAVLPSRSAKVFRTSGPLGDCVALTDGTVMKRRIHLWK